MGPCGRPRTKGYRVKVLVVDDDRSIRHLLQIAFSVEERVTEVREASNGQEAVDICVVYEPDLVFLDHWMPLMDGEEAAAQIRRMHPNARIVAFSGTLDEKPPWADELYVKGDLPDLGLVIDLNEGTA